MTKSIAGIGSVVGVFIAISTLTVYAQSELIYSSNYDLAVNLMHSKMPHNDSLKPNAPCPVICGRAGFHDQSGRRGGG